MRGWPLLGASLLLACDSPPLMRPAVPAAAAPLAVASGAPGAAAAQKLLFTAATAATAAGAGALSVVAAELAAEGDRVGAFVEPPEGACLLALARGAEGVEDIDLLSFNDEGTPLAVDEATDPSPALLLCPPHPGRVYLMARVMSGRGLVAVGALPVPLAAALRVGKALNARGRPGASGREAESWPGLDEKSAALRRGVGGQWREARRAAVPAEARAPGHLTEPIEAGRCLLIQATPSDETSDIDAQIRDQFPLNATPLYDVTQSSYDDLVGQYDGSKINAVVLLTDGQNDDGDTSDDRDQLNRLLASLRRGTEGESSKPIRIFPIAYGKAADLDTLTAIAEATNAAAYDASNPATITKVFTAVVSNF